MRLLRRGRSIPRSRRGSLCRGRGPERPKQLCGQGEISCRCGLLGESIARENRSAAVVEIKKPEVGGQTTSQHMKQKHKTSVENKQTKDRAAEGMLRGGCKDA